MKTIKAVLGICLLVLCASCIRDTCNEIGETFQTIELDDVQLDATGQLVVSLYSEALKELPERYFEDGTISETYLDSTVDGAETLDSYMLQKDSFKITFKQEVLPLEGGNNPLSIAFEFPDRRGYIDCKHAGMSDSYFVLLKMEVRNNGAEGFDVGNFEWSQYTAHGAL